MLSLSPSLPAISRRTREDKDCQAQGKGRKATAASFRPREKTPECPPPPGETWLRLNAGVRRLLPTSAGATEGTSHVLLRYNIPELFWRLTCALFLSILTGNTFDPVVPTPGQRSPGKLAASGRHGVVLGLARG